MKLLDLIKDTNIIDILNKDINIDVLGITADSRKVRPGFIFVAIKGYKTCGYNFISQALENGALGVVVEDFQDYDVLQIRVENSREALSSLASSFFDQPSKKLTAIGITATNGKTTTSFMLKSILERARLETGIVGTVFVKYKDFVEPSILTTPESVDLQRHIKNMIEEDVSHLIMEVSSSALELKRVNDIDFDIVTFNNISHDHLDLHGSFEAYYRVKSSLIRNLKPSGWAILNLDCPYSKNLIDKTLGRVLSYGVEDKTGDIYVDNLDISTGIGHFDLVIQNELVLGDRVIKPTSFRVNLSVPGYHSVCNSIVAIGVSLLLGLDIETIKRGISDFKGVERRFEFIYDEEFKIIDDHFANIGNIDVTLRTLALMDYESLNLVYAIRGSRGVSTNRENAETIVKWARELNLKEIIATTSSSHVMDKDLVLEEELAVFEKIMAENNIGVKLFEELPPAIEEGLNRTKTGDILLLAGCQGMDFGGELALKEIFRRNPGLNREKLFKPLENRVAGIEE